MTQSPGYRINVGVGGLDLGDSSALAERAGLLSPVRRGEAAKTLRGHCLWRGDALADFAYEPVRETTVARLEEAPLGA